MRFAPGPSGPLHIGHTRAAFLNHEYCERYDGKFILRMEDTNPEKIDPDAYRTIPEDLDWLGIKVDEIYIQSERFEEYYKISRELIENGHGYVCTMDVEEWRDLKNRSLPCPERDEEPEKQLERWDKMMEGGYEEGEAFFVVKTDLKHKNPAVRDFVGMRIRNAPHPKTGKRYHLYPLYNLSVAIDDHLMGCTHILRGNDHLNNTTRQLYVYEHMEWEKPDFIHYGLVSIPDVNLKTSLIREDISKGLYKDWSDERLGTVRALAARGYDPGSIKRYWLEVGTKSVDINFSWETLSTMNREIIDPVSERYFFVKDPVLMRIHTSEPLFGKAPLHPQEPGKGSRDYHLKPIDGIVNVNLDPEDLKDIETGNELRLKDLVNIRINKTGPWEAEKIEASISDIKARGGSIVHWTPEDSVPCDLRYPDGRKIQGLMERSGIASAERGATVQFERVGFFRITSENGIIGRFSHK